LAWNSVHGATGYLVDEKINGAWKQIAKVGGGVTSHPVPGLSAGTTYSFEVGAYNYYSYGGPSWSSSISAETIFPMANGTYLRDASTGAIDIIESGLGCWLSPTAYASLSNPSVTNISDAAFQTIPAGPNYTIPNGTYLRDSSPGANYGKTDIIEYGLGFWLSPAAYASLGSPGVTNISDAAFQTIPTTPNGTYVRDATTGAIDIMENGQGEWLSPSVYAFLGNPVYLDIPHAAFASLPSGPNYIPSTTNGTWSGWVIDPSSQVNAVGATWVQPAVSSTGAKSETSFWVGIDGYGGNTVEQIGTSWSPSGGYQAWVEFYGDCTGYQTQPDGTKTPINPGQFYFQTNLNSIIGSNYFNIQAGDTISACVTYVSSTSTTSTFDFRFTDTPKGGQASKYWQQTLTTQHVVPARSTGEWIVESPNQGSAPLANFGTIQFSEASATVGGNTGPISAFNPTALNMTPTATGSGTDYTSGLGDIPGAGWDSNFTVTFGSANSTDEGFPPALAGLGTLTLYPAEKEAAPSAVTNPGASSSAVDMVENTRAITSSNTNGDTGARVQLSANEVDTEYSAPTPIPAKLNVDYFATDKIMANLDGFGIFS
jgi:hypothetical protein